MAFRNNLPKRLSHQYMCRLPGLDSEPGRRRLYMRKLVGLAFPVALIVAPLAFAAPSAQSTSGPSATPRPPAQKAQPPAHTKTPKVSPRDMHEFAHAYVNMSNVRSHYLLKLQKTKNPKKVAAIQSRAKKAEKKTIRKYMRVRDYIKIGKKINSSVTLRRRFLAILQEQNKSKAPSKVTRGM